ncbi:MAG: hypothetical protein ACI8TL_001234 [Natronomonas sp.]|jgi:hypothetical protein
MDRNEEASAHDRMQRYEELAEQERESRAQKRAMLDDVSEELTGVVERAISAAGANVAVDSTSSDGRTQTLRARLDRAALVAAVTDELPSGFIVKRVNDDGTLAIEWSRRESSAEQRAMVILQAIVAEEIITDADELITDAPTRQEVIERAAELGVDEDLAGERLQRLDDIGKVDIEEGRVFPG